MPVSLRPLGPLMLALSLAACASRPVAPPIVGQQPGQQSDVLAQTTWELARWTLPGGALRPVPHAHSNERPITLTFTRQADRGQATGFCGCNNYSAQYVVANGSLLLQDTPVSTRMACPAANMELEQEYLAGLTRVTKTQFDNVGNPARMSLTLSTGDVLDFARR
ncbi:META domain-containing protein [Bordetella holmesii]|uniref:META domain protein n=2 Tax=Bordetella holmesii TaxID=35814 RepID=A0A158LZK6_9BORD|nr:META domain-containing protein [Bordetella holmesii]AHV94788.1 META domain protein [Bordetella holmesii ATCC 51541]AIT25201.1 META domain protein [Bordetella holmesii 44057]EWM45769.1 META domain protein [Bordetella holmesii 70147]EWM48741.1 META domain protein [Bordetella holmesii 41130]EWM49898.1 META domain protein [Bordetella holmesii 35009]